MARAVVLAAVCRAALVLKSSPPQPMFLRSGFPAQEPIFIATKHLPLPNPSWVLRNLSHGWVNFVISHWKPKFQMHEIDRPKKEEVADQEEVEAAENEREAGEKCCQ